MGCLPLAQSGRFSGYLIRRRLVLHRWPDDKVRYIWTTGLCLTVLVTRKWWFQFKVLPFGLCIAPVTWSICLPVVSRRIGPCRTWNNDPLFYVENGTYHMKNTGPPRSILLRVHRNYLIYMSYVLTLHMVTMECTHVRSLWPILQ